MSLTLHLPLIHRRPKCPPAPPRVVRTAPVCHCPAINHAVGVDAQAAAKAELLIAQLRNQACLIAALEMRMLPCPTAGPSGVSR